MLVNTIGPVWDGNEVWLIVAGAVIFAAFPGWYATMFSTFYLALVVVLLALMRPRAVLRVPAQSRRPAVALHLALDADDRERPHPTARRRRPGRPAPRAPHRQGHSFTGSFFDLLTPFGLWTGVTMLVLSLLIGATYLSLKTTGELPSGHRRLAARSRRRRWW